MVYRSTVCLTRVVVDDHARLDVAQIQAVMGRIEAALKEIPEGKRTYIANALLSFAVAHCSPRCAMRDVDAAGRPGERFAIYTLT